MKKFSLLILSFAFCVFAEINAATQTILLKNGSVLYGYIQKQDGRGRMTICTDSALICLTKNVFPYVIQNSDNVSVGGFKAGKFSKESNDSVFMRYISDKVFNQIRLIEKGEIIRFMDLSTNKYEISWSDVLSIRSPKRAKEELSGIVRHYTLANNREISGEYAGETETTVSIYLPDGIVETVNFADVKKYTLSPFNPNQDIFAQTPLLDVVYTTNNNVYRGVIIEQNYSNEKNEDNYISIWEKDKSPQMVRISEIESISKEKNDTTVYNPLYDVILKKGELVVNRKEVAYVGFQDTEKYFVLDSLPQTTVIPYAAGAKICVEYYNEEKTNVEKYKLVRVVKNTPKKGDVKYAISKSDLIYSFYQPKNGITTSVNNTAKAEYEIPATPNSVYALFDAENKKIVPIIIK